MLNRLGLVIHWLGIIIGIVAVVIGLDEAELIDRTEYLPWSRDCGQYRDSVMSAADGRIRF